MYLGCCHDVTFLVFSHGHMDHISAVPQHVSKRSLFGQKMARYYTPPHLTHKLKRVCEVFHEINETCEPLKNVDVTGIGPGEIAEVHVLQSSILGETSAVDTV